MEPRPPEPSDSDDPLDQPVNRRAATAVGAGFAYVGVGLSIVRNLGLVPLFVASIGTLEYGAWLATGAVLVQLTNVDFGLLGALGQRVARAYGAGERQTLERLIGSGVLVAVGFALLAGAIAAAIAPLAASAMDVGGDVGTRLVQCILIACVANVLQLAGFGVAAVLRNLQRPGVPSSLETLGEFLSLASTVWMIYAGFGLYAIALGLVVRGGIVLIGNAIAFLAIIVFELKIRPAWDWSLTRSLLGDSAYVFATQLAIRVRSYCDPFLVGIVLGPTAAGVFALTIRSHETIKLIVAQFGLAVLPGLSHLYGERNERRLFEMIAARYKLATLIASIGLGGCIAFNGSFMQLWVGDDLFAGNPFNLLLAISGLAFITSGSAYDALFARGEFRTVSRVVGMYALGRLPLVWWGLWGWGLLGAALATVVSTFALFAVPVTRALAKRQTLPERAARRLWRQLGTVLTGSFALSLVALQVLPPAASWLELGAQVVGFTGIALPLALALDPAFARFLIRRGTGSPL